MKQKIIAALFIFATTQIFALPIFSPPKTCPSVQAIKAQTVDANSIHQLDNGKWVFVKENTKFDTSEKWTFVLGPFISATNKKQVVFEEVTSVLPSLEYTNGPILGVDNYWQCHYVTDHGFTAAAYYPGFTVSK